MIQPIQRGAMLMQDIRTSQAQPGQVIIWWLGQSGYAIKTASALFYVDLYLSEHLTAKYAQTEKPHIRMTEAPLRGDDLKEVEWLFASHKHSDHLDPGTIPGLLAAHPQARLVLPAPIVDYVVGLGLRREQLIAARGDESAQVGPLRVHYIPAAHPELDYDPQTGYPFLGFVFEVDGLCMYHSGDTLLYDGLAERLANYPIDIAFLPINGTSPRLLELGVPPNMNMDEAISLGQQIGARLVIPHHYDMFTFNTADVMEFAARADAAALPYRILRCAEKFTWEKHS